MKDVNFRCILLIFLLFISFPSVAQNISDLDTSGNKYILIRNIEFTGNKQTKEFVFRNEMTFWEGDSIKASEFETVLRLNENLILKSSLFNSATIKPVFLAPGQADLLIDIVERWYIFPSLNFSLIDRNFNEWWNTYNHDLRRTIYGVSLYIDNVRGRSERLKFTTLFGFNQLYEISYEVPHLSTRSRWGLNTNLKYLRSRDIFWQTQNNKLTFLHSSNYMREFFKAGISLKYRTNIYVNHLLHFEFHNNSIDDTVAMLNPDYFLNASTHQRFFQVGYQLIDDHRDAAAYPLHGYYFNFILLKKGLSIFDDINTTLARTDITKYLQIAPNLFSEHNLRMQVSFPFRQPYYNQQGLGFGGDVVRGYELYVIDGQHFILSRNTFKYKILHFIIEKPLFSIKKFNNIPFTFFLTTHLDMGYVKDNYYFNENPLNNEFLKGAGIGLDIISYYDFTFGLTYSINRHKEKGLYLSFDL